MRVMTFNLRFENDDDGKNAWYYRRELVVEIISRYRPDILGTQEGKWSQLMYLKEHLKSYNAHLPDREPDPYTQCPTIFFRKSCFSVVNGRDLWLSETPDVFLSKNWDSAFPRMMSYAQLVSDASGKHFCAAVTHLDHIGTEARVHQAEIIAEWSKTVEMPLIVMGDFNDAPGSDSYNILTAPETGLVDTWPVLDRQEDERSYTHHGFTGVPQLARMDWILVGPCFTVKDAGIVRDNYNGSFPSDHYPYFVDLECG